jgi:hypothetical protein
MILLDILLFIMIIICVVYCWMLNRRIQDLQNSRVEFARMIKELNASIIKAETNIKEMSELSKVTSTEIRSVVDEARESISELVNISQIASDISSSLGEQMKSLGNQHTKNYETAYEHIISSKPNDKFSEEDFAPEPEKEKGINYTNNLKNFIHNIVTKKPETDNSLSKISYYDTLRKINVKK